MKKYKTFAELKNDKINYSGTTNINFIKELDELREVLSKTKRKIKGSDKIKNRKK